MSLSHKERAKWPLLCVEIHQHALYAFALFLLDTFEDKEKYVRILHVPSCFTIECLGPWHVSFYLLQDVDHAYNSSSSPKDTGREDR